MRLLLTLTITILLAGCSIKKTTFVLSPSQCKDGVTYYYIDAKGVEVETLTDQTSDGEMPINLPLGGAK